MVKKSRSGFRATKKKAARETRRHAPRYPMPKGGKPLQRPKTSNPEIHVKKSTYSKSLRLAVLASAAARTRLIEMGGENTINIIRDFDKDMSDEELARKANIKASDARVVLNRLHSHGLFSYTRVRDRDSGWYSYIWKMSEDRLKEFAFVEPQRSAEGEVVENGADKYHCLACSPGKCLGFEGAMDAQFRCERCGSGLVLFEKARK